MKINTDGVLLGALVPANDPHRILDVGTGTGVIALMLAQRFENAMIDAVEIDPEAAATASANFRNSAFSARLHLYSSSFQEYLQQPGPFGYDLIISNPPFFIRSLKNSSFKKHTARHTDLSFFTSLIALATSHLNAAGKLSLVLPPDTAGLVADVALQAGLSLVHDLAICSFPEALPHRRILTWSPEYKKTETESFHIYEREKQYSQTYQRALKDFFTIF